MKRQASVGLFYFYTVFIITLLLAVISLSSCSTAKNSCHTKKAYVAKNIIKAQSKPRY
jgi:hypothetical protein